MASASAVEVPTSEALSISLNARHSTAVEALNRAGIALGGDNPWPGELVADLAAGLEALPRRWRQVPGGTLTLELHDEASPFGMGDGTSDRPDWTDGLARFHLYAFADTAEPRAEVRLENLSPARSESLWRRRALVHAVIRRWDAQRRWSEEPSWRQIVGWLSPFERPLTFTTRPLIDYPWAFSRERGLESPALDLATFAEEALVPAEAFGADVLASDDRVRCQEFSKSRVLAGFLGNGEALDSLAPDGCRAFDEWAAFDGFSHVEVLFSAPSGGRPQSLFGHVSLRLVRKPSERVQGPGAQTIVELAALTGPAEGGAEYLLKGLSGGFKAVFSTTSLSALLKQNLEIEQRSIHRYRLELTRNESLRVLQRIWELERRGYVDYYFFSENCAQMLVFLLNAVMDEGRSIDSPGRFLAFPSSALDALAKVTVTQTLHGAASVQRPLLTSLEPHFPSSLELAKEAEAERSATLEKLVSSMSAQRGARWKDVHARLRRPDVEARRVVYEEKLETLIEQSLTEAPSLLPLVHAYVTASTRIERHALDLIDAQRLDVDLRRMQLPDDTPVPTTDEMLRTRQASFHRETPGKRQEAEMARATALNALLLSSPRREPTAKEAKILADAERQRRVFAASLELHGHLVDLVGIAPAGPSALSPDETSPAPLPTDARWQEASGERRLALALGVAQSGSETMTPTLSWRTALLADALGEARGRGIGAQSELRLFDVKSTWALRLGWPRHLRTDMTVIGFRSLLRPPETLRTSALDWLGWGWDIETFMRPGRAESLRAVVAAELIAPFFVSASGQSHTLLALGVAPEVRAQWLPKAFALGPRARLSHRSHFGGAHANALRTELAYQPRWTLWGRGDVFWQAWRAELSVSRLFFGRVALGLQAELSIDIETEAAWPYWSASVVGDW